MDNKGLSLFNVQKTQELIKLNEDLIGFYKQYHQFESALKELDRIKEDIKNKKITQAYIPSLGGMLFRVNPNGKDYKKMITDKEIQFSNSMKGIKGQILHREDSFFETIKRLHLSYGTHMINNGIEPMDAQKYIDEQKPKQVV